MRSVLLLVALFGFCTSTARAEEAAAEDGASLAAQQQAAMQRLQQFQQELGVDKETMLTILPIVMEHTKSLRSTAARIRRQGPSRRMRNQLRKADKIARKALSAHLSEEQMETYFTRIRGAADGRR